MACKYCDKEENLVHSATDALLLDSMEDLYKICYGCANLRKNEQVKVNDWERGYDAGRANALKELETQAYLRYLREKETLIQEEKIRLANVFRGYITDDEPELNQFLPISTVIAIILDQDTQDYAKE